MITLSLKLHATHKEAITLNSLCNPRDGFHGNHVQFRRPRTYLHILFVQKKKTFIMYDLWPYFGLTPSQGFDVYEINRINLWRLEWQIQGVGLLGSCTPTVNGMPKGQNGLFNFFLYYPTFYSCCYCVSITVKIKIQ